MKYTQVAAIAVIAASVTLGGCASIFGDSESKVGVYAVPQTTTFSIKDSANRVVQTGTTPSQVLLKSSRGYFQKETYTVVFHREGQADDVHVLTPSVSGWYWGNLLLGGLIGMLIVDPLTGAMYTLPEDVTARPLVMVDQVEAA